MEFSSREEGFNVKKTALSWGVVEKVCIFVSVFGRRKMLHCQRWRGGGGILRKWDDHLKGGF